jgi:type I restriction enzyme S subunit
VSHYKRYPEYKASGVEWLGNIPLHWRTIRLRFVADFNPSPNWQELEQSGPDYPFLPMEAIGERGELDLTRRKPLEEAKSGYTYFSEGDVVYAKVTPCFENGKGAVIRGLESKHGFGTTELTVLRPKGTSPEFLYAILHSYVFRDPAASSMTGAGGLKRVPDDFARGFVVAVPSISEQRKQASGLNRALKRIDALTSKKTRLINLLKEKRQALILHAVTKGIDPNAEMKDSKLEWVGEIPAHWTVPRIKHCLRLVGQGWSPQCESYPAEEDQWGVLKVGCVNGGAFDRTQNKALPKEMDPQPELSLKAGDLLISRANTRELVGSAAVVKRDEPKLLLCDKLYRFRAYPAVSDVGFVALYLGTPGVRSQVELEATGTSSSMLNISQATILELPLPFPPIAEQCAIVAYVEKTVGRLERLIGLVEQSIDRLIERRSALITAAVTGQIDLRGET